MPKNDKGLDCRFIDEDIGNGPLIYLRKEDVVRLIREAITISTETCKSGDDLRKVLALADKLERIER